MTPSISRGLTIGMSGTASNPGRSTNRWPARLPLSTVEMYTGSNGFNDSVSYQFKKCPR